VLKEEFTYREATFSGVRCVCCWIIVVDFHVSL